jgi:hypothetical protein
MRCPHDQDDILRARLWRTYIPGAEDQFEDKKNGERLVIVYERFWMLD